jgi:hypothetical protein
MPFSAMYLSMLALILLYTASAASRLLPRSRGELQGGAVQAVQATEQLHAFAGEATQVDVAPAVAAGDVMVSVVAHTLTQRVYINTNVVVAHLGQPVDHVLAAIEARTTGRIAYSQKHFAPRQMQVFGDLRTGLPGTDDQHIALWQRLRIAVLLGMNLGDPAGRRSARRGMIGV